MKYWMICLPREDIEHCIKIGVFGLNRKHILGKVHEGDGVVCCASKNDWKIIAIGNAISDYYLDTSKIFLKDGLFPDRFGFEVKRLSAPNEVDLKQIIDKLSFVTNLAYWAVYFRNGIVEMSHADWTLVVESLSEK